MFWIIKNLSISTCLLLLLLISYFNTGAVVFAAWLSSVMDPCSLSDICDSCHQLATCKALNGSNNACLCERGYTGDGTTFCKGEYEKIQASYTFSRLYNEARQLDCVCSSHGSLDCLLFVTAHRKQTETVGQHWCIHTWVNFTIFRVCGLTER